MTRISLQLGRWPFHPILLAAFPVVFLLAENVHEYAALQAVPLLVTTVLGAAGLLLLLQRLLHDRQKAGLVVSVLVLGFFSYGHMADVIDARTKAPIGRGIELGLISLWLLLVGIGTFLAVRTSRPLEGMTLALNAGAGILVGLNLFTLGLSGPSNDGPATAPVIAAGGETDSFKPDIYYLVPDRYGAQSTLRNDFGLDNRPFLNFLRQKGFYVADQSTSNYSNTAHSLASSLNLDYLDGLTAHVERPSEDLEPLYDLIRENAVAAFLKEQGYQYYNLGSWYTPTETSPIADKNFEYPSSNDVGRLFPTELHRILYRTTLAWGVGKQFGLGVNDFDPRRRHYAQGLWQFDQLSEIKDAPGPKFVFAHMSISHGPHVFDRNGRFITESREVRYGYVRSFREQLEFANRKLTDLINELLDAPDGRAPVILLQADEGPYTLEGVESPDSKGRTPDEREIAEESRKRFPILNAIYTPGTTPAYYQSVTPVNNFRILFNHLFQTDLPVLPDENYGWRRPDLYTFENRTHFLNSQRRGLGGRVP